MPYISTQNNSVVLFVSSICTQIRMEILGEKFGLLYMCIYKELVEKESSLFHLKMNITCSKQKLSKSNLTNTLIN